MCKIDLPNPVDAVGDLIDSTNDILGFSVDPIVEFVDESMSNAVHSVEDFFDVLINPPTFDIPKDQGYQIQKQFDSNSSLPLVFGSTKIGGVVVSKEVSSDYQYLHVFYAVCATKNDVTIDRIYIDGENGTDAEWVYNHQTNTYNPATRFANNVLFKVSEYDNGFGTFPSDNGSTIYSGLTAIFGKMVAVYARYKYDRNVFQGEPRLKFEVRNTMVGSSNPAACLEDYLTDSLHGAGLSALEIGTSFASAKTLCDELVTNPDSSTSPRYTFNGVIDTSNTIDDNIKLFLSVMDADIYFGENDTYEISLRGQGDAVVTFTKDNIVGDVTFATVDNRSLFNQVVVNFTDSSNNYKTNSAIIKSSNLTYPYAGYASDFRLVRDGGKLKEKRITVNGVSSFYEAQRYAEKVLKKNLFGDTIELSALWETNKVEVGQIVGVTLDELGFANKEFRVVEKQFNVSGAVKFKLIEHEDTIYDITYNNQEPSAGTITYPNPWAILPAPTGFSITDISNGKAQAEFTELTSSIVDTYVVEAVNVANANQIFRFYENSSPIYFEIDENATYEVRVYAISDLQKQGTPTAPITWVSNGFDKEWDSVTGTNKPEDYATYSRTFYQSTAPTVFSANDIWVDISVLPNKVKVRNATNTGWVISATLNTGTLADKDSVDLSTTEVLNKTADNISETASKKWAGETGADKTITAVENDLVIANGGVVINAGGSFKSNGYNLTTNNGIFYGYTGGAYQFMIGDGSNSFMRFDGTTLNVGAFAKIRGTEAFKNDSIYLSLPYSRGIDYISTKLGSTSSSEPTTIPGTMVLYLNAANSLNRRIHQPALGVPMWNDTTWNKNRYFKSRVVVNNNGATDCRIFWGIGDDGSDSTAVGNMVGFLSINGTLYAISGGGTATTTSSSIIATLTNNNLYEIRFYTGVKVEFYLNGSLVATITTNLPSGTNFPNSFATYAIRSGAASNVDGITIKPSISWAAFKFLQDE